MKKEKLYKIVKWFSASFEGADGNLSSKKASVFAFTTFVAFMIIFTAFIFYKHPNANQVFPDIAWIMVTSGAVGFAASQVYQSIHKNKNP